MKIVIASNGKKTLKISRNEWYDIGYNGGWIKSSRNRKIIKSHEINYKNRDKQVFIINKINELCNNLIAKFGEKESEKKIEKFLNDRFQIYSYQSVFPSAWEEHNKKHARSIEMEEQETQSAEYRNDGEEDDQPDEYYEYLNKLVDERLKDEINLPYGYIFNKGGRAWYLELKGIKENDSNTYRSSSSSFKNSLIELAEERPSWFNNSWDNDLMN